MAVSGSAWMNGCIHSGNCSDEKNTPGQRCTSAASPGSSARTRSRSSCARLATSSPSPPKQAAPQHDQDHQGRQAAP